MCIPYSSRRIDATGKIFLSGCYENSSHVACGLLKMTKWHTMKSSSLELSSQNANKRNGARRKRLSVGAHASIFSSPRCILLCFLYGGNHAPFVVADYSAINSVKADPASSFSRS
eukprot:4636078-Pleurochrysis_carterae.AAC.1